MAIPRNMDPADPQFDLFTSPFYLIAHADFRYHEDLDKVMAKWDVDRTTYRLLTVLLAVGLENIKVISGHALLKRSTCSRAIDRMREKEWVRTEANTSDNRETKVELTPAGKKLALTLLASTSKQLHRAADGISAAEIRQLADILQRMTANLSRLQIE